MTRARYVYGLFFMMLLGSFAQGATITGTVFNDLNGNALADAGEPGLAGWTVQLTSGNMLVSSTVTNGSGAYSFTVAQGNYSVSDVQQIGWLLTTASPFNVAVSDQAVSGLNFGEFQTVSVSGQVYNDLNGNAVLNPGEPGLAGWTVMLDGIPSVTNGSGNFRFTGVGPGSHSIQQLMQAGWIQTTAAFPAFATTSGVNVSGLNFGDTRAAAVPEPAAFQLTGIALIAGIVTRRARKQNALTTPVQP